MRKNEVSEIVSILFSPFTSKGLTVYTGACCNRLFIGKESPSGCSTCRTVPIVFKIEKESDTKQIEAKLMEIAED